MPSLVGSEMCIRDRSTTLQRYRAQQQQATPCACGRSALYCVELLWKAPEIHHPPHLLVPGISRLLLTLFCFVRHKAQIHVTAHNYSASAKSTLQPAYLSRPAAAGNGMHVWQTSAVRCRVAVETEVRHPSHLSLCWSYILLQQLHVACMHARGFVPARRC